MEKYRFDAVLDKKTSEKCRDLDGKVFLLKDAEEGKNYPPMHPNCRSLAVAVIDRKFTKNMTRMATDPKTGETQEIPFDMGYREWEAWQRAGAPKDVKAWRKAKNPLKNGADSDKMKLHFTDKQVGKKFGEHCADYGLNPAKAEDREKMRSIITDICENADNSFKGEWRGASTPVIFFIKGDDAVITLEDGRFHTIMKGGASNVRLTNQRK